MQPLRFVVIGIGGFSLVHIRAVEWLAEQGLAQLTGVVALETERKTKPEFVQSLLEKNITLYKTIDHFFDEGVHSADVLTVPIGIHMHVPVSIRAMQAGLDVYCEKPTAAIIQEVDELIRVKQQTGRKIAIGYQHIYSNSIQQLKNRICDGRLGHVKSISLLCGWPRSRQYYERNNWAGKLRLDGHWILDSPANNANAHYLMNVLFLTSPELKKSANPIELRAELFRASHIESTDLVELKFTADSGTNCHIIFSHCNWQVLGPIMKLQCEKGNVTWQKDNSEAAISYSNGETEALNNLTHEQWRFDGFKNLVEVIHKNEEPICTPELTRPQTVAINTMHESCPEIATIPEVFIVEMEDDEMFPPDTKGNFRRAKDLDRIMNEAIDKNCFLSELGIEWAKQVKSKVLKAENYKQFSGLLKI